MGDKGFNCTDDDTNKVRKGMRKNRASRHEGATDAIVPRRMGPTSLMISGRTLVKLDHIGGQLRLAGCISNTQNSKC
ncbi:hypothetical protein AAMO2058_001006600 [Amorphochlora amoebiformis]